MVDPTGAEGVYDEEAGVCRVEYPTCSPENPAGVTSAEPAPAAPAPAGGGGHVIPPPPPVSGPDYTLYVSQGFAYTQYREVAREVDNPANPMWVRGTFFVLGSLAAPLALAEEYVARPIANVPFTVHNAGTGIGEHIGRAYLWSQQGETGEAVVESLRSVTSFSQGFVAAGAVAVPVAGALESRATSTVTSQVLREGAALEPAAVADTTVATDAASGTAARPAIPAPAPNTVANGSLGPYNGVTSPNLTVQNPGGVSGQLGLRTPTFNPTIDVVASPVNSTFAGVARHKAVHASDMLNFPQFSYLGTTSRLPGRGIAAYIMETRGYYAEFGARGLLPSYAWRSMTTMERWYFVGETTAVGAGTGYGGYRLSTSGDR